MSIKIKSLNISEKKGVVKNPVEEVTVDQLGIKGDAHAGYWHRQISILSEESVQAFVHKTGRQVNAGEFAENITISGIDLNKVSLLDRFQINDVILEVTQIGKKCHGNGCAIFNEVGECVMPKEGIFARVIKGGVIKTGDSMECFPTPLTIIIITLSDRASKGEYADLSGPKVKAKLDIFYKDKRWHLETENKIIPDEAETLKQELINCKDTGIKIIFTTGGTGIGTRDITPDVIEKLADKVIPGIMEFIRLKYGESKPNALLSRSIAAVMGKTLVYALPGSVKAVEEYMDEILPTLEHSIEMLFGLGH